MSVLFTPSITLCASRVAQLVQLIKINEKKKKKSTCNVGDPDWIPGSGRSSGEGIGYTHQYSWASLVAQMVKNSPAMWETWVRSLGWEGSLVKEMATHCNIQAWRIPWTNDPGRLQSMGSQRVRDDCSVLLLY